MRYAASPTPGLTLLSWEWFNVWCNVHVVYSTSPGPDSLYNPVDSSVFGAMRGVVYGKAPEADTFYGFVDVSVHAAVYGSPRA